MEKKTERWQVRGGVDGKIGGEGRKREKKKKRKRDIEVEAGGAIMSGERRKQSEE